MIFGQIWAPQRNTGEYRGASQNVISGGKKRDLFCKYCKKSGMLRRNVISWWVIHNILSLTSKKKGPNGNKQVNATICGSDLPLGIVGDTVSTLVASQGFTKEQCN